MIYVCEVNKTDGEHEVINSCVIQMLNMLYPEAKIGLWSSKDHWEKIKSVAPVRCVNYFIKVIRPVDGNKINWAFKFFVESISVFRVLFRARLEKPRFILFNSLSAFGHFTLSLCKQYIFRDVVIIVTVHGELELLRCDTMASTADKLLGMLLSKAMRANPRSLYYLLLNHQIEERVIEDGLIDSERLLCIDHPYVFPSVASKKMPDFTWTFGHIGVAKASKHSELFFELANRCREEILNEKARFIVVGRVLDDLGMNFPFVEYSDTYEFLDRNTYLNRLSEVNYALFFYDDEGYRLTGSGAVMDALAYEIPILSLKNWNITRLFSIPGIKPGCVVESVDELYVYVKKIIYGDFDEIYRQQVDDIKKLKNMFSPVSISKELASELTRIGIY